MSCAARHAKKVLCFECYRSRLDVKPERRFANVTLFPRAVFPPVRSASAFRIPDPRSPIPDPRFPARQLEHRRQMLVHLTAAAAQAGREAASHLRTFGRTAAPPHPRTVAPNDQAS